MTLVVNYRKHKYAQYIIYLGNVYNFWTLAILIALYLACSFTVIILALLCFAEKETR